MPEDQQIITILKKLEAYYARSLTREQAAVYLELLKPVALPALRHAARAWIRRSPFFPKVSELLQESARYTPPSPSPAQGLLLWQRQLEHAFYHQGKLDLAEWEALVRQFEEHDQPHSAQACRLRLSHHLALIEAQPGAEP